jgi:hypothetical protein
MLERDRKRRGIRECRMAWLLGLTVREYHELDAGDRLPDFEACDGSTGSSVGRGRSPAERSAMEDEDAKLRDSLASLGPGAIADFRRVLEAPQTYRDALLRQSIARPQLADLATLIAMAHTDEVVRLRLRRAIRDVAS